MKVLANTEKEVVVTTIPKGQSREIVLVICSCIVGKLDCPYCHGEGKVWAEVIGKPYQTE